MSLPQARERAERHGWDLTHMNREVLGWVCLLTPSAGHAWILYDLDQLDDYLPR